MEQLSIDLYELELPDEDIDLLKGLVATTAKMITGVTAQDVSGSGMYEEDKLAYMSVVVTLHKGGYVAVYINLKEKKLFCDVICNDGGKLDTILVFFAKHFPHGYREISKSKRGHTHFLEDGTPNDIVLTERHCISNKK